MKSFNYFQDTRIVFGSGKIEEAGRITRKYGKNCLLVSTPVKEVRRPFYDRVTKILEQEGLQVTHFDGVSPNPTTDDVTSGAILARKVNAEVVLGLGGGSSMDAAKAIAVEATHEGTSWDYLFYKKQPTDNTLPIVTIATTSGTGSQVTQVAVVTNPAERNKSALYNEVLYPQVSIVDPELMTTVPKYVTATTGFDVFSHAFESLLHPNRGAYVDLMAKEAIRIVSNNLHKVLKEPRDLGSRSAMAWADTLAGLCIANSGVTLPHGIGMAIGGMYPQVAHGQALAIIYPSCIAYSWEDAIEQYAFLSRTFNPTLNGESDYNAAKIASKEITKFISEIQLTLKLRDIDMPQSEVEPLARQSMVLPDYKNHPKVATYVDMVEILNDCY